MVKSVRFVIHYSTTNQQNIVLVGDSYFLGEWDLKRGIRMGYLEHGTWTMEVVLPKEAAHSTFQYKYVLVDDSNGATFWEAGPNRSLDASTLEECNGSIELRDTFQAGHLPEFTWLDTKLIQSVFDRPIDETISHISNSKLAPSSAESNNGIIVQLRLLAQAVQPFQNVVIVGSMPSLGDWHLDAAPKLSYLGESQWGIDISLPHSVGGFEYKFVIEADTKHPELPPLEHLLAPQWETGSNRIFRRSNSSPFKTSVEPTASEPSIVRLNEIFRRHVNWRASGIAIPIFSLRTSSGMGIGEFSDLKLLVDLCRSIGCKLIQILPVNDTSCFLNWRDSYPYSSLSVFALHPIYLHLQSLTNNESLIRRMMAKSDELNQKQQIDYEAVTEAKKAFLKEIFLLEKQNIQRDSGFKSWAELNQDWLVPYTVFVYLRDQHGTSDYSKWPEFSKPSKQEIFDLYSKLIHSSEDSSASSPAISANLSTKDYIQMTHWTQYQLHCQLQEASFYAESNRVGLKGDLPIGVNRVSVDSWLNHDLFHMNMSTGAPPDQFSEDGQNWGFPTYDWEKMAEDNYSWWRKRLTQMSQYFHAFRIDHILGFFRIWEIPIEYCSGMMGHYNPSINIHRHQLEQAGIWDIRRLVEPHIRFDLISNYFVPSPPNPISHDETLHIVENFMNLIGNDRYALKPEFDNEAKIHAYLDSLPTDTDEAEAWKDKVGKALLASVKNVVLVPHPTDPDMFFPRVNLIQSASYQELTSDWKSILYNMYVNYFYGHQQEEFWRRVASARLPVIRGATKMLVCGEDLGMVPECVEPVMNSLGILGLRVQRMPPNPKIVFGNPSTYSHLTVCTTSSHDTSTLRGWWEEDRSKTVEFYRHSLLGQGHAPQFCEPAIVEKILNQHFHSPSMLAIFPIQDFFAIDEDLRVSDPASEKINDPANPKHYWRYRIHIPLEELLTKSSWLDRLSAYNSNSGRI